MGPAERFIAFYLTYFILFCGTGFAIFGLILGSILSYFYLAVYHRARRIPARKQGIGWLRRLALVFLLGFVVGPLFCATYMYVVTIDHHDLRSDRIPADMQRMLLEKPYELTMDDTFEHASIVGEWENSSSIVSGVERYEKNGPYIAGYCGEGLSGSRKVTWFLFDCGTGLVQEFDSEQSMTEAWQRLGLAAPLRMKTIRENWDLYWSNPDRRRK